MYFKTLTITMLLPSILAATPARAVMVVDPVNDFLPTYTAGPKLADLDVTSFSVNYNSVSALFTLGATFAGEIDPSTAGFYVFGVNTGTGTVRPFGSIGEPNVIFNQAIAIQKNGTGAIGATALDPSTISIAGNILTARVPLALLPSTGFGPNQYGFNLWPRIGAGNNNQITDFAPENATLAVAAVPEPATWVMMLFGFGAVGASFRYRRRSTTVATA
jgi:hypothetical protein